MPGPSNSKSKAKLTQKKTDSSRSESVSGIPKVQLVADPFKDIDHASDWDLRMRVLCDFFNLPGMLLRECCRRTGNPYWSQISPPGVA